MMAGKNIEKKSGLDFEKCLKEVEAFHGSACSGSILGTRMAILGLNALGIDDPKGADRKNLMVYVETDRCVSDAILAVTGCHPGKRTFKFMDYGKIAATFVHLKTGKAFRVSAINKDGSKILTREDIEKAPHSKEYAMGPIEDLFEVKEVRVNLHPEDLPGKPMRIVTCEACGEQVMDMRDECREGKIMCRSCAMGDGRYYRDNENNTNKDIQDKRESDNGNGYYKNLIEDRIDIRMIDWNRVWKSQIAKKESPRKGAAFWDGRAASFAKAIEESEFSDNFIDIMKPEPEWSVLDMGCGSGTLAIPLAKKCSSVTAVDFSEEMLKFIRKCCRKGNIENVKTVNAEWDSDWQKAGIGMHDIAIASRSMVSDDIRSSILKLQSRARKRIYIVTVVGDGPHNRQVLEAAGRTFKPGPDYIYNYNLLYQMGISANISFIEERRNIGYESHEDALKALMWMFSGITLDEKTKVHDFLKNNLVLKNGLWKMPEDRLIRWAVIWWEK